MKMVMGGGGGGGKAIGRKKLRYREFNGKSGSINCENYHAIDHDSKFGDTIDSIPSATLCLDNDDERVWENR